MSTKVYIKVPFDDKEEAKKLGARFDGDLKMWYITDKIDYNKFTKWNIYLNSTYSEKEEIKSKGGKYCPELKKWYVTSGLSIVEFKKWLPEIVPEIVNETPKKLSQKVNEADNNSSQFQINLVLPSTTLVDSTKEKEELKKIKSEIKDNCSFSVNELKEILKSRGIKGMQNKSKQELIDKCMELKLLNTVLQVAAPIAPIVPKEKKTESKKRKKEEVTLQPAPPVDFECPILMEIMIDPVICSDGISYERKAIEDWFARGNMTSPKTNAALSNKNLIPNHTLKALINDWKSINSK